MNYILCDDPGIRAELLPLTFTRPVALLRIGIGTLREKWNFFLGEDSGFHVPKYLQAKFPFRQDEWNLLVNASFVPDAGLARAVASLPREEVLLAKGEWVAFWARRTEFHEWEQGVCFSGRKEVSYQGDCLQIRHLWDIFIRNGRQIEADFSTRLREKGDCLPCGTEVRRMGEFPVYAEEGAKADFSLLDTTEGPIFLGKGSRIMPGCYVKGPFALCEGALVKAGSKLYGGCTIGPYCKVAGEIESTVMIGYSNKAHDGFLGDAVLGEWCNLGAGTNNSNLKNDYSPVRVWSYAQERFVKTGLQFCGLFMGDHSKSAIGTQFNTGTVVGVGANVFAAGFPKNFVPSFTWGKETYKVERAIETAKTVWARRNKVFDEVEAEILKSIYEQTTGNRERSQQEDLRS